MYDTITGRITDVFFAFPVVLLAVAIVSMLGPGEPSVVVAVAMASLPNFARLTLGDSPGAGTGVRDGGRTIFVLVVSLNLVGDGVRDVLDPYRHNC